MPSRKRKMPSGGALSIRKKFKSPYYPPEILNPKKNASHLVAKYKPLCRLGSGKNGEVFLYAPRDNGTQKSLLALKFLHDQEKGFLSLYEESIITNTIFQEFFGKKNAFIMCFKNKQPSHTGPFCKSNHAMVMPYLEGPNLTKFFNTIIERHLQKKNSTTNTIINLIMDWSKKIILTIQHIHSHWILHGDIQRENFIVTAQGIIPIDFGSAFYMGILFSPKRMSSPPTTSHLAPEFHTEKEIKISEKQDIFSLGMLFFSLLEIWEVQAKQQQKILPKHLGALLETFYLKLHTQKQSADFKQSIMKIENNILKGYLLLIYSLCHTDPSKRPTLDSATTTLLKLMKNSVEAKQSPTDRKKITRTTSTGSTHPPYKTPASYSHHSNQP